MFEGTLVTVAPSAGPIGPLLRTAIDAEQVGATRLHLPLDQSDLPLALAGLREHTALVVTCTAEIAGLDVITSGFTDAALDADLTRPDAVAAVARLVADHPAGISVTGRGALALPVLLAALAAGGHVQVRDDPPPDDGRDRPARDHVALVARACGLARIAGRPPLSREAARAMLGLPAGAGGRGGTR